jgi:hypothetical protein
MKPKEPTPRAFVISLWYEQVNHIRLTDPRRYFIFSPTTKHCLFVYLMMKQRALEEARAA